MGRGGWTLWAGYRVVEQGRGQVSGGCDEGCGVEGQEGDEEM